MPLTPLLHKNYLMMIRTSVGSRMFGSYFVRDGKRTRDILENGRLSCAAYVSWILYHFNLLKEPHVTVSGTIRDLKRSGWRTTRRPIAGDILVWEGIRYADGLHRHIGFFLGNRQAASNSPRTWHPVIHHWTFGMRKGKPARKIETMFTHPRLRG
ncbi:MAG: hypothetical protein V1778_00400 [bacterium]